MTSNFSNIVVPVLNFPSALHEGEQDQTKLTPSSISPPAMDVTGLDTRLRQVEKAGQKVTERIGDFQAEDVTLVDKETFRGYIESTKTVMVTFRELSSDLRSELDPEDTNEKVSIDTLTMAEQKLQINKSPRRRAA